MCKLQLGAAAALFLVTLEWKVIARFAF